MTNELREKRDAYNAYHRQYYKRKVQDPEWKARWLKKCREANARYRAKQKAGQAPKKKGRPIKQDPLSKYYSDE